MRKMRFCVLGLAAAVFGQTGTTLLSTTATGAVNAGLAGMAVDQAGNRYLAIALYNVRTQPGPQILFGGDPTRGIAVQKIGLDGSIAYTAWLTGITDVGLPKMTVNAAGEVYLAGVTRSQYIVATPGAISQPVTGQRGYLLKVSADGDRVLTTALLDFGFFGASVARIALDPEQNIFLAVNYASLQSTPGTFTPATASSTSPFVIKLDPAASNILVASRVTEANETLSDMTLDSGGNLYIAGYTGAGQEGAPYQRDLISRDGGATWSVAAESALTDLDGRWGRITIHPTDAATLFQTGRGGIFRSSDSGANWSKLGAGLEPYSIQGLFIHPLTPDLMFVLAAPAIDAPTVFRSEDGGVTWSPVSSEPSITRIVFDPLDPSYVFLDNRLALIRSTDGGRTFERVASTLQSPSGRVNENAWNLTVARTSPPLMYGYTRFGLASSADHGQTWQSAYFACGICPVLPVFTDASDRSLLYAAGTAYGSTSGLVTSGDGGATWKLTSNQAQFDSASVRRSESKPSEFFANIQGRVMRTTDAGMTWTPAPGLVERLLPSSFEPAPSDSSVIYATFRRGSDLFVRKLDSNVSQALYTAVAGGFGAETVARIQVDRAGRIYIAGSTNSIDFPAGSPIPEGDTYDAFVIAFDPASAGPDPIYSQRAGGAGRTTAADIAVDCAGNTALALTTTTPDLAASQDALQAGIASGSDVLLLQYDPSGALSYASYFGGEKDDSAAAVGVDGDGRIHFAGYTASSSLPGLSQLQAGQNMFTSTVRSSLGSCR